MQILFCTFFYSSNLLKNLKIYYHNYIVYYKSTHLKINIWHGIHSSFKKKRKHQSTVTTEVIVTIYGCTQALTFSSNTNCCSTQFFFQLDIDRALRIKYVTYYTMWLHQQYTEMRTCLQFRKKCENQIYIKDIVNKLTIKE